MEIIRTLAEGFKPCVLCDASTYNVAIFIEKGKNEKHVRICPRDWAWFHKMLKILWQDLNFTYTPNERQLDCLIDWRIVPGGARQKTDS